jgi:hypothetical protein
MSRFEFRPAAFWILALATYACATPSAYAQVTEAKAELVPAVTLTTTKASEIESAATASSTSTTETTIPDDVTYYFRIGLYPTVPIRSVKMKLGWEDYPSDYLSCTALPVAGNPAATIAIVDEGQRLAVDLDFGSAGLLQSQRLLRCLISAWHGDAWWNPIVEIVEARDLQGQLVEISGKLCLDCGRSQPPNWGAPSPSDYDTCGSNVCGDVVADGVLNVTDALLLLKTAVGTDPKYIQRHDVDRSGELTAMDALRVLRRAVELPGVLYCEDPPAADCGFDYVTTTTSSTSTLPAP